MLQLPDLMGTSYTVANIEQASQFYQTLYPHEKVAQGVFAGIDYIAIYRGGEVGICLFQQGEGNPLAASFPTFRVDSVAEYEQKVADMGGSVLIPAHSCPCTAMPFAICVDANGNQFMIKEARPQ